MFLSWQWIALIVLALLGGLATIHFQRRAEAVAERLSKDERQIFYTKYMNRSDRAGMPAKFDELAAAADRVRGARTGVTVILAITLLFFVI
ncbi:MAG: hypothetical protein ACOCY0_02355 [Roseicyclus sp.]